MSYRDTFSKRPSNTAVSRDTFACYVSKTATLI